MNADGTPSEWDPSGSQDTRRLSSVLVQLGETSAERISLDDILSALSERSFGALMILFAALNLVPLLPERRLSSVFRWCSYRSRC